MQKTAPNGLHYIKQGFYQIRQPGVRAFVLIPLLINIVLLASATFYVFNSLSFWYNGMKDSEYTVVQWIFSNFEWLLWPLTIIGVMIGVFFLFAMLANWIAAPFNGLLSESVEQNLAGKNFKQTEFSFNLFIKDLPRLMAREWKKLAYYLPRALVCLLIIFTPLALIAPIIWFLLNAWMAAIQYIDYPMDNHKVGFQESIQFCKGNRQLAMGFGSIVMLLTMIPIVNILIMPIAVAGGTALWYDATSRQSTYSQT